MIGGSPFAGGGGGGFGGLVVASRKGNAGGDIALGTSYAVLSDGTNIEVSIPAVAGDILLVCFSGTFYTGGAAGLAAASLKIAGVAVVADGLHYISSTGNASLLTMTYPHTVQPGDISGGNVLVTPVFKYATTATSCGNNSTWTRPVLTVVNLG